MTFFNIHLLDIVTGEEMALPHSSDSQVGFALALGNFDGVHAAHRELINVTIDAAEKLCKSGKLIHPAAFFFRVPSGDFISMAQSEHLTTLEEKLCLFRSCGLRFAFIADFPSLRNCDADAFMQEVLKDMCAAHAVCCGYNFRFGKNGAGTPEQLKNVFGENCTILARQSACLDSNACNETVTISSSTIRQLLKNGNSCQAACLLSYPYVISGSVTYGKQLGRNLGFPTANLAIPSGKLLPRCGVYASIVLVDGTAYYGVSNVGKRPTVDSPSVSVNCETHLLDFSNNLYGKQIYVFLLYHLRDEIAFPSIDALQTTISNDVQQAKFLLQTEQSSEFLRRALDYFKFS
jgi:riboflavin kinase/FMN adenylyltransferase